MSAGSTEKVGIRFWGTRGSLPTPLPTFEVEECEQLGPDLPLYSGAQLMVCDGQYSLMETMQKVNRGHATASMGLKIALREAIPRVLFMHHDPAAGDAAITAAAQQVRRFHESRRREARREGRELPAVEWDFAIAGRVLEV
jgi:hypothetical protein